MNVFTGIMLAFALIGFADKVFSLRWGLTGSFEKGLMTMGTMVIPIVGVCTIGVEFIERHADTFLALSDSLVFDPSLIIGALLAPDLGGYFIAEAVAATPDILIINGVVLGTLLGQAICFQLPVFLSSVGKENYPGMLKGFLVGITMIPIGMLSAEAILRMDFVVFLKQFIPILIICMLVALGLYKIPNGMIKGFMVCGKAISNNNQFDVCCGDTGDFHTADQVRRHGRSGKCTADRSKICDNHFGLTCHVGIDPEAFQEKNPEIRCETRNQ